jgi:hypothetical protein
MKPATVAPRPRPKLPATRRSAVDAARCRDQGQGQDLARGSHESEAGTGDGRADEALPRTVDERQAPVAECVHDIARDQDPFRTETIEKRTGRERYHCGRAHDRRQHQPCGRRREAADRVEVDDLEGKDQSRAEVVERVPALKNEDRPRQARTPSGEHTSQRAARFTISVLHQLTPDSSLCRRQRHRDAAKRTAGPFPTDPVSCGTR